MTMSNQHKGKTGMTRLWNALGYSRDGLVSAWHGEAAFRQEVLLALLLLPAAWVLDVTAAERAIMVACVFLVLIVELINSAIEAVVDRVSLDDHALSKRAKDIGSAAVLLALAMTVSVWAAILVPRHWH